ncbi:MAG: FKBP-type peptidyl-prolyl cis-trans isomerase [Odoribacteraceae bacterium]|jgi:FKBP-type peptidyl-prolyl cis-trans isomerase FklB|nr:FKBP-type peptidyl-prolyl cis-trans isomerase [Odoribacteraceae bacterium]
MNTKFFILILSIVTLATASCCNYTQTQASLKNDTDTVSFYLGYNFGEQLRSMGIQPNLQAYVAGINAALQKKEAPADPQAMGMYMNTYGQKAVAAKGEKTKKEGEDFLAANGKKTGVTTTASGLQYKVESTGDGPIPTATDRVKVHYKGTHLDGSEFDSSRTRGEPFEFEVGSGVIPGWSEAIQLMPVGSKWTIYIPASLAYGERGTYGGPIGPNEALIFEVELMEIVVPAVNENEGEHDHAH